MGKTNSSGRPTSAPKWGQGRRLEFIDFRLLWEGRVNRYDLTSYFGISVPQASMDLARYQELAPGNMIYDKRQKTYVVHAPFTPLVRPTNAYSFLNAIRQVEAQLLPKESTMLGWCPPTGVVQLPTRRVDVEILRRSLEAIRRNSKVTIRYQSMNRPEPSDRSISPHAVAFDGIRWHLRAYCYERKDFRDFVLSRITRLEDDGSSAVGPVDDSSWFRMVSVVIAAAPHLAEGRRLAVEMDYGMNLGHLEILVREALLLYLLQQLPLYSPIGRSKHNQIVLQNREELQPILSRLGIDID
jgi:hypothetical protein